jgi:hypothetical protein
MYYVTSKGMHCIALASKATVGIQCPCIKRGLTRDHNRGYNLGTLLMRIWLPLHYGTNNVVSHQPSYNILYVSDFSLVLLKGMLYVSIHTLSFTVTNYKCFVCIMFTHASKASNPITNIVFLLPLAFLSKRIVHIWILRLMSE